MEEKKEELIARINNLKVKIGNNNKLISKAKRRTVAYLTAMAILLTGASYAHSSEKKNRRQVVYNTETYTYNDYTNSTSYDKSYTSKMDKEETILIKKLFPWEIFDREGKRKVITYDIDNATYERLLSGEDIDYLIANLDFIKQENEIKYKNELRNYDRYSEPIHEVLIILQDYNDSKVVYKNISIEFILTVIAELLVYLLVLNINGGPLIESLIIEMTIIEQNETINDGYRARLHSLIKEYRKLYKTKKLTKKSH